VTVTGRRTLDSPEVATPLPEKHVGSYRHGLLAAGRDRRSRSSHIDRQEGEV
jgi:hypothetical protein